MLKITCSDLIKINEIITKTGSYYKNNSPCSILASIEYIDDDIDKIIFIYYKLIKNHHFLDGNKRTATLFLLNFFPDLDDNFLFNLAIRIAEGKYTLEQVINSIKRKINA